MKEKQQDYLFHIDLNIWKNFKAKTSLDGYYLRDAIEHFIKLYLEGKVKLPPK